MLQIIVPGVELYDEVNNLFITAEKDQILQLEHSLVSLSKWESHWHKAFFSKREKTSEEVLDYIRCMTITRNVDPTVYDRLTYENIAQIDNYINESMTATYFSEDKNKPKASREVVTSELIYYWMIAQGIPIECERWHLSRLLTLIRVCNIKNSPPRKMSRKSILAQNAALNAARRKQYNTKG